VPLDHTDSSNKIFVEVASVQKYLHRTSFFCSSEIKETLSIYNKLQTHAHSFDEKVLLASHAAARGFKDSSAFFTEFNNTTAVLVDEVKDTSTTATSQTKSFFFQKKEHDIQIYSVETLAKGTFGEVNKLTNIVDKTQLAMKRAISFEVTFFQHEVDVRKIFNSSPHLQETAKDIGTLTYLSTDKVEKRPSSIIGRVTQWISSALIPKGSCIRVFSAQEHNQFTLETLYEGDYKHKPLPKNSAGFAQEFMQGLQGLQAMHERNIVHNDIKTANILYDKDGILIADHGCDTIMDDPLWMIKTSGCMNKIPLGADRGEQSRLLQQARALYDTKTVLTELTTTPGSTLIKNYQQKQEQLDKREQDLDALLGKEGKSGKDFSIYMPKLDQIHDELESVQRCLELLNFIGPFPSTEQIEKEMNDCKEAYTKLTKQIDSYQLGFTYAERLGKFLGIQVGTKFPDEYITELETKLQDPTLSPDMQNLLSIVVGMCNPDLGERLSIEQALTKLQAITEPPEPKGPLAGG